MAEKDASISSEKPLGANTRTDDSYLFRPACRNCDFCTGLGEFETGDTAPRGDSREHSLAGETPEENVIDARGSVNIVELFKSLSFFDRYLAIFILIAMITGVLIGVYARERVERAFGGAEWQGVSIPILIGLIIMMWPVLTKVQYEVLPLLFRSRRLWVHIAVSCFLNWILAPFIMLAVAWATLPEASLSRERKGVILVGIARCIAMVLVWNSIAQGDKEYCAILVCVNSILQVALFSPYALLLVNILGGPSGDPIKLDYGHTAISVCIYLGIPLLAGIITRALAKKFLSRRKFDLFLQYFSPITLIGLLYTITVLFANQGNQIVHHIGPVFRIFVPLVLYFCIMWASTFFGLYMIARGRYGHLIGSYDKVVVQAFTAGSNNFELAIAVAIANFGFRSREVLAATIGPLVEVPVLLMLSYLALFLRGRLNWESKPAIALP